MIYRRYVPGEPLASWIEFFWFYEGLYPDHQREHVLPDGTFELVINLRDESRKLFDRANPDRYQSFQRGWLSGTHSEYIIIDALPGSSMIGAHFRPGGISPFLDAPADQMRDRVIELDALWSSSAWDLRDALLAAPSPQGKFLVLERYLLAQFKMDRHKHRRPERVRWALRQFQQQSDLVAVGRVAHELGMSHKHFIDEFRRVVGLTPKLFCRVQRFQNVVSRLAQKRPISWAEVAAHCGYFDQPHFIHDFQSFSGLSPSNFLCADPEYANFVPLRD